MQHVKLMKDFLLKCRIFAPFLTKRFFVDFASIQSAGKKSKRERG